MPIDFPNTPEVNDIFTVDTRSWKWTGSVWESVTTTAEGAEYTAGTNISLDGDAISVVASPSLSTVRLTATTDASLSSTGHAFQIGPTSGVNLIADGNEIITRNNGAVSGLSINQDGGNVTLGGSGSTVTVNGTFVAPVSSATQTALNLKANVASPTFTGTPTAPIIRLTTTTDASLSSTGHAFQIGADSGANLIIDNNEIMSRNNGVGSFLGINIDGGTVEIGSASSTVTLNGTLVGRFLPAGAITQFAGASAPSGYLLCSGQAVSRSTFSTLFSAIGTTYGVGDGSTTFNLPNLQNRVPVGKGAGTFANLNDTGGAETHTLTTAQMPSHTHTQNSHNHTQNSHTHTGPSHTHSGPSHSHNITVIDGRTSVNRGTGTTGTQTPDAPIVSKSTSVAGTGATGAAGTGNTGSTTPTNNSTTATNQNTGGGGAHNNLQPYIVLNYIIKT
jgi:microcystin-dependent protein